MVRIGIYVYLLIAVIVGVKVYKEIVAIPIRGGLFPKLVDGFLKTVALRIASVNGILWPIMYPLWRKWGKDITFRFLYKKLVRLGWFKKVVKIKKGGEMNAKS